MSSKRLQKGKALKLHEILDVLEADDVDVPFPMVVSILPPENANAEVTDEDSGDEDFVNIQNLPGTQLRAEAEVTYDYTSSEDEENNIPLSWLAKRRRTVKTPEHTSSPAEFIRDVSVSSPVPATSANDCGMVPTVSRNQHYKWRNRHSSNSFPEWKVAQAPHNMQPPIYYNRGLKSTGTIRENRISKCPLPSNSEFKKKERGTFQYKSSHPGNILVCKWNDNSVVTVGSNFASVEPLHKAKRFSQQMKKYVQIDQPAVIKLYNENMGGVDRSDQKIGLYRTSVRGKKWYFPLIAHCLDMSVHNAWQLYKHDKGEYDHLSFRRAVARSLLETFKSDGKRGPSRTPASHRETSRYDKMDHLVAYKDNQLRCVLCKKKTNFVCKKCDIHLHPKSCTIP